MGNQINYSSLWYNFPSRPHKHLFERQPLPDGKLYPMLDPTFVYRTKEETAEFCTAAGKSPYQIAVYRPEYFLMMELGAAIAVNAKTFDKNLFELASSIRSSIPPEAINIMLEHLSLFRETLHHDINGLIHNSDNLLADESILNKYGKERIEELFTNIKTRIVEGQYHPGQYYTYDEDRQRNIALIVSEYITDVLYNEYASKYIQEFASPYIEQGFKLGILEPAPFYDRTDPTHKNVVITGAPASGKTSVFKELIHNLESEGYKHEDFLLTSGEKRRHFCASVFNIEGKQGNYLPPLVNEDAKILDEMIITKLTELMKQNKRRLLIHDNSRALAEEGYYATSIPENGSLSVSMIEVSPETSIARSIERKNTTGREENINRIQRIHKEMPGVLMHLVKEQNGKDIEFKLLNGEVENGYTLPLIAKIDLKNRRINIYNPEAFCRFFQKSKINYQARPSKHTSNLEECLTSLYDELYAPESKDLRLHTDWIHELSQFLDINFVRLKGAQYIDENIYANIPRGSKRVNILDDDILIDALAHDLAIFTLLKEFEIPPIVNHYYSAFNTFPLSADELIKAPHRNEELAQGIVHTTFLDENVIRTNILERSEICQATGLRPRQVIAYTPQRLLLHEIIATLNVEAKFNSDDQRQETIMSIYSDLKQDPILERIITERDRIAQKVHAALQGDTETNTEYANIVKNIRKNIQDRINLGIYTPGIVKLEDGSEIKSHENLDSIVEKCSIDAIYQEYARNEIQHLVSRHITGLISNHHLDPIDEAETLHLISGPPASGKTTFVNGGFSGRPVIDYDQNRSLLLPQSKEMGIHYAQLTTEESDIIMEMTLERLYKKAKTTKKLPNTLIDCSEIKEVIVSSADEVGSNLKCAIMCTPAEKALFRSYQRGLECNRFSHSVNLLKQHKRFSATIPQFISDNMGKNITLEFYDTDVPKGVPCPIIARANLSEGMLDIYDVEALCMFLKKKEIDIPDLITPSVVAPNYLYKPCNPKNVVTPLLELTNAFTTVNLRGAGGKVHTTKSLGEWRTVDQSVKRSACQGDILNQVLCNTLYTNGTHAQKSKAESRILM